MQLKPDLEVPISTSEGDERATAALFGVHGRTAWSEGDVRQFRIAAEIIAEALRRIAAESELGEQQIWLLMAMESAAVGVWDWNVATDRVRFLALSDARTDGPLVQETRASTAAEWCHPEDLQETSSEIEGVISGAADTFSRVVRQRLRSDPGGEWRQIYSRGRVIERDKAGRAVRVMGTFEDVTEAHERAQAAKERDAAMARAARMASLGVLASSLAHDLNQPLTALTSYLEGTVRLISAGEAAEADVTEALERSVAFAHRASNTVRRFRQLFQRQAPLDDPLDLASLLREVRDLMRREAAASGVEIEVPEGPGSVVIRGDALQIQQVVINLVRNAIEAFDGTGRRRVRLDARLADNLAEVRVADNGPGLPAEVLGSLFEPMASSKGAGRGLGLAICQSIAEIHGGRLYLQETGPQGTTFVLRLPCGLGGGL